jgi:nitric oxide dioxygenase
MLPSQQKLLQSSLPMFREQGETIVGVFYEDAFLSHPHLSSRFSMEDQVNGSQAERFTAALVAYVETLQQEDEARPSLVASTRAHQKHNVKSHHYVVFRAHFLKAFQMVLRECATPELLEAWGAAYDELAAAMMAAESSVHSA